MIGPGFNRIKAHVISYTVKSLRKFGRISNSSTRDGEMNMKLLRASDRGTRQTHVHDHCVNVLITVEASELQESLEEPRPTKIRRRDTHQFQITSIFSQGGHVNNGQRSILISVMVFMGRRFHLSSRLRNLGHRHGRKFCVLERGFVILQSRCWIFLTR